MTVHLAKGITGKTRCGRRIHVSGTADLETSLHVDFLECADRCKICQKWTPKTKSEKIVLQLEQAGFIESEPTSKYRRFARPGNMNFFFIGKSGALRYGPTAGKSRSFTNNVDTVLSKLERKNGHKLLQC